LGLKLGPALNPEKNNLLPTVVKLAVGFLLKDEIGYAIVNLLALIKMQNERIEFYENDTALVWF